MNTANSTPTPRKNHHPRKRESAVATAEQIQKLVAVIQRQFTLRPSANDTTNRPDDAAARALGYQLGKALVTFVTVCLDENFLQSVREEQVLEGLWCRHASGGGAQQQYPLHPSVAAALFQQLQQAYQDDKEDVIDLHWLTTWILRLEEAATTPGMSSSSKTSLQSTLQLALHTYRTTLLQHAEVTAGQFLQLYQRLRHESTRLQLIALALPVASITTSSSSTSKPQRDLLAPLWTVAALRPNSPEAWAILTHTSHVVRKVVIRPTTTINAVFKVLAGMQRALEWSLLLPLQEQYSTSTTTWWTAWWHELIQLGQVCWRYRVAGNPLTIPQFITWWQGLWTETLPCLLEATDASTTEDVFALYLYPQEEYFLNEMAKRNPSEWSLVKQPLGFSSSSALAWASWLLSSPTDKQAAYQFWMATTKDSDCNTVRSLRRIVTLCLASDEHWYVTMEADEETWPLSSTTQSDRFALLAPLLPVSTKESHSLWKELLENCDFSQSNCSPIQQSAALLCGVLLLQNSRHDGFLFLDKLLQRYSHLSITLMPLVVSLLGRAATRLDGNEFLDVLDVACRVLVLDPHCAIEFWNVLLKLLQPEQSAVSLRGTILRYFPKLCQANKRLYRRIIETLGGAVGEGTLEIRLAVSATVAELAQHDLVRDVADVIGWIQGWLSITEPQKPKERLIVYYALESLHHLMVAEELDFDVVVKVLS